MNNDWVEYKNQFNVKNAMTDIIVIHKWSFKLDATKCLGDNRYQRKQHNDGNPSWYTRLGFYIYFWNQRNCEWPWDNEV